MIIVAHLVTLTLSPEAGERGLLLLPVPLGEGWGEGAFPRIDAQSCYDVRCVPSFEILSKVSPYSPSGCADQTHRGADTVLYLRNRVLSLTCRISEIRSRIPNRPPSGATVKRGKTPYPRNGEGWGGVFRFGTELTKRRTKLLRTILHFGLTQERSVS